MNEAKSKPRLLMFLHGVLVLFTIGSALSLLMNLAPAMREIRTGQGIDSLVTIILATLSLVFCAAALHAIAKRKENATFLGSMAFIGLAIQTIGSFICYSLFPDSPELRRVGSAPIYIAFMVLQASAYVLAAAAFLMSRPIKEYFNPNLRPSDEPPSPPNFIDQVPSPTACPPEDPFPTTPRGLPIE